MRPEHSHKPQWEALYAAYADFYRVEQTDDMRERVWSWIVDASHQVECFVAVDDAGELVGFAHFREFARPLAASRAGFLDDLFVAPTARGSGAAEALLAKLAEEAGRRDWSVVRWITADDNYRARGFYDKIAQRTTWITYDMQPVDPAEDPKV